MEIFFAVCEKLFSHTVQTNSHQKPHRPSPPLLGTLPHDTKRNQTSRQSVPPVSSTPWRCFCERSSGGRAITISTPTFIRLFGLLSLNITQHHQQSSTSLLVEFLSDPSPFLGHGFLYRSLCFCRLLLLNCV